MPSTSHIPFQKLYHFRRDLLHRGLLHQARAICSLAFRWASTLLALLHWRVQTPRRATFFSLRARSSFVSSLAEDPFELCYQKGSLPGAALAPSTPVSAQFCVDPSDGSSYFSNSLSTFADWLSRVCRVHVHGFSRGFSGILQRFKV